MVSGGCPAPPVMALVARRALECLSADGRGGNPDADAGAWAAGLVGRRRLRTVDRRILDLVRHREPPRRSATPGPGPCARGGAWAWQNGGRAGFAGWAAWRQETSARRREALDGGGCSARGRGGWRCGMQAHRRAMAGGGAEEVLMGAQDHRGAAGMLLLTRMLMPMLLLTRMLTRILTRILTRELPLLRAPTLRRSGRARACDGWMSCCG